MRSPLSHRLFRLLSLLLVVSILCAGPAGAQEDLRAQAIQLNQQGGQAYEAGQYDRALSLFQRSLDLFQRAGDPRGVRTGLSNIGLIYRSLNQNKKALEYYDRALALADESDPRGLSKLLGNVASLAIDLGQFETAIRYFNRSVEISQALGDHVNLALTLDGLGQAYARMRQFDRALEYQMRAWAEIEPTGDLRLQAIILSNIGATGKGKGDYNLATRYLEKALELKRRFSSRADIASSLTNLALIYFDQGKLEPSAKAFAECIELHEGISREVRDASKVGEYQDWFRSSLYRRYAHVLINQKKTEEALTVLERGRNQGLSRQAAQNRADFSGVLAVTDARRLQSAQSAFQSASAALQQIEGLEYLADSDPNSGKSVQIREIRRRYTDADQTLTALRNELSARSPAYRRLSGTAAPTIANLKELAAKNPDALYLQWAIGAEATSLLFTLSAKDGLQSFVLPVGEGMLTKQVKAWRTAIKRGDAQPEATLARVLYDALFSAVEKAGLLAPDRYARLLCVGDGPLLELPYAALMDGENKRLVERFPVAVAPSLGVLTWPEEQKKPAASLLVAADPGIGEDALPAARTEARAVAGLFSGARVLIGAEATRKQVLPELGRYGILHFATHGLLDPEDGLKSGLLLAQEKGSEEMALLTAQELINTRLAAQLAVLSACETGQGQQSGGEGLLGLTWAFRAAGCPSVLASLWSVDDEATAKLMVRFYEGLKAGKRKDEALREAVLSVKQTQPLPVFWAAFQLNGTTGSISL